MLNFSEYIKEAKKNSCNCWDGYKRVAGTEPCAPGSCVKESVELDEGKPGLWSNIHAKRKRIKAGSGERMRKAGEKGRPTAADFKASQNEEVVAESDLDRFKKYTRPVVKTVPKIERTTNPAGRSTDHVEWKVTTPTGEIHRHKSKKEAQAHYDSFSKQGVSEELSADEQFDIIEEAIEQLAEDNGIDSEAIWETLESIDDIELLEYAIDKKGHKSSTGGLTQKGVDAYNAKTGGNLQTAVTTPPSKLKPGSKAANRRKSFCARMGGMPGAMKDDKGRPTRKALALRKWNC